MATMLARCSLTILLSAAVASLAAADGGPGPSAYCFAPPDDDHELRRGEWAMVEMKQGGIVLPRDFLQAAQLEITLKPDKFVMRFEGKTEEGLYRLNTDRGAREIDIQAHDVTMLGIFELSGDRLKMALGHKRRPRDFTGKDADEGVIILERVRK
jgi:uncharacterized protein (TIGR03067 family)